MATLLLIEIAIFILVFVPTMVAFLTGAPWVPTPAARAKKMVELANIKPGERVYDLGCGDGRLVHYAAKMRQADAVGIELSPLIYLMGCIRNFLLRSHAKMRMRDFRNVDLSNAGVVFFYLLPNALKNLKPKLEKELRPGTRVVSYAFEVDGWTPDYIEPKDPAKNLSRILVYKIPFTSPPTQAAHSPKYE